MKNLFVIAVIILSHKVLSIEGNDATVIVNVRNNGKPEMLVYQINRYSNIANLLGIINVVDSYHTFDSTSPMNAIKKEAFSDY